MKLRKSQGRKTKNMNVQSKKGRMGRNIKIRRERSKSIFSCPSFQRQKTLLKVR